MANKIEQSALVSFLSQTSQTPRGFLILFMKKADF